MPSTEGPPARAGAPPAAVHPPVSASVDELLGPDAMRAPMTSADSKSGARFERVSRADGNFVLKHVDRRDDWIMRQTGDLGCVPVRVWESGTQLLTPPSIDHATVGVARTADGGAVLMHDVGRYLVPDDGSPLALADHLALVDALARFHATCWGWRDDVGLIPLANRYSFFGPAALECEAALGDPGPVTALAREGWARLGHVAPDLANALAPLRHQPYPLVDALGATPHTFLHGDWKLGNLGRRPDGRVVLVDWSLCGAGPPLAELAHYLALNCARLPRGHTKDDTIAVYRAALERHGIATGPWWDRQLALCTVGMMLQLGWEKSFDDSGEELGWWRERTLRALARLDLPIG